MLISDATAEEENAACSVGPTCNDIVLYGGQLSCRCVGHSNCPIAHNGQRNAFRILEAVPRLGEEADDDRDDRKMDAGDSTRLSPGSTRR